MLKVEHKYSTSLEKTKNITRREMREEKTRKNLIPAKTFKKAGINQGSLSMERTAQTPGMKFTLLNVEIREKWF